MACEPRLSQVFLSGLLPVFKVSIRNDASGRWLENSIRFSVDQADASRAGGEAVLAKLSEVLFVETLRLYIPHLPTGQTGWLAGAGDPEVGRALALMHRNPAHPWTIAALAAEAGVSRSVLGGTINRPDRRGTKVRPDQTFTIAATSCLFKCGRNWRDGADRGVARQGTWNNR
jgi:hypothetical protein